MSFSFSRTRPAVWLAAAVLLVSCSSSIDRVSSPQMRVSGPSFLTGGEVPTMVITEFMANPEGTDDPFEWFEIYNGTGSTMNMNGMVFGTANEIGFAVTTDLFVPANGYGLFVRSAQGPAPAGAPRFVYGIGAGSDKFVLNNSNTDWVTIKTSDGRLVDSLAYAVRTNGVPGSYSSTSGTARAKRSPVRDCSVAADITAWGNATTVITSFATSRNDKGTPGAANDVSGYTYTGSCVTTPPPAAGPLDRVTVSGGTSVAAGASITLTAFAEDAQGVRITPVTFTWTSSNAAIATVSGVGVVTGVAAGGPITITATTTVNGITKSGTSQLTVQPPSGASIAIFGRVPSDPAIPVGFQDQLFATKTGLTVARWDALNADIATIDARGVVTSRAAGSATFKVTMSDSSSRTTTLPMEVGTTGDASLYGNNVLFGAATVGGSDSDIRVTRPQYSLSYNKSRGGPNWVAYRLTKANRGDLPGYRCDCFATDPAVTADGETGLTTADYTGSGYDRGHMVRSNDRELGTRDQATTYYLSNIVPQFAANNQGRWADFESYLQTVEEGAGLPDVYIVTGGRGEASRIANGRIAVPTYTWKVALVVRNGATLASIRQPSDILDVIAIDMPNVSNLPRDGNWQANRVTVDSVEKVTGFDLLAALPNYVETIIESGDRRPTASYTGATSGNEGVTLTFDGSGSSDPDIGTPLNDMLSYQWAVNGVVQGINPMLNATFADDGAYAVQLIVSDIYGWADTTTKTVSIANVAPAIASFAGATIIRGETYGSSGTFTDPGADTWTATVNYGDGSGTQTLALSGKSFSLAHTYATAGTVTVTVTVQDDELGTASRTATVVIASAADAIGTLSSQVTALQTAGTLSNGESNALDASLRNALKSLDKDNPTPARNQLEAFINKVQAMQQSGRLDASNASALIAYAQRIIASII